MNTLQKTILDMMEQNANAAKLQTECMEASRKNEFIHRDLDDLLKTYGKNLRNCIARRARGMVRKHANSWGVEVDVFPLHSGITNLSSTFVNMEWDSGRAKIKLSSMARNSEQVEHLLERFEAMVIASQLHVERP